MFKLCHYRPAASLPGGGWFVGGPKLAKGDRVGWGGVCVWGGEGITIVSGPGGGSFEPPEPPPPPWLRACIMYRKSSISVTFCLGDICDSGNSRWMFWHNWRSPCWGPGGMWSSGGTGVAQLVARSTLDRCVSVRVPPVELNISAFPPVLRDWVVNGLGMSSLVYATGHTKDPVPLIEKRRGLSPDGRFPPSFIHQVIIITGLNRLYTCMFSPWRWRKPPTQTKTQLKSPKANEANTGWSGAKYKRVVCCGHLGPGK